MRTAPLTTIHRLSSTAAAVPTRAAWGRRRSSPRDASRSCIAEPSPPKCALRASARRIRSNSPRRCRGCLAHHLPIAAGRRAPWNRTKVLFRPSADVLRLDEHAFYARVGLLDAAVELVDDLVRPGARDVTGDVHADIGEDVFGPHVHG